MPFDENKPIQGQPQETQGGGQMPAQQTQNEQVPPQEQEVGQNDVAQMISANASPLIKEINQRAQTILSEYRKEPDAFIEKAVEVKEDLLRMKGITYAMMPYTDVLYRDPTTFGDLFVSPRDEERKRGFEEYIGFLSKTSGLSFDEIKNNLNYQRDIGEAILKVTGQIGNVFELIRDEKDKQYYLNNCLGNRNATQDSKCSEITDNLNKLILAGPTIGEYRMIYDLAAGMDKEELNRNIYWNAFMSGVKSMIPFVGSASTQHRLETLQKMAFYAGADYSDWGVSLAQGFGQVLPLAGAALLSTIAPWLPAVGRSATMVSAIRTAASAYSIASSAYAAYDASKLNQEEMFSLTLDNLEKSGLYAASVVKKHMEVLKASGMGYNLLDESLALFRDLSKMELNVASSAEGEQMWKDMMDNITTALDTTFYGSLAINSVLEIASSTLQMGTALAASSLRRSVLADLVNSTPLMRSLSKVGSGIYDVFTGMSKGIAMIYNPLGALFESASSKGGRAILLGMGSEFFEELGQEMFEKVFTNLGSAIAIRGTFQDWQKYSGAASAYYLNKMEELDLAKQWVITSALETFGDLSAWEEALMAGIAGGLGGGISMGVNVAIGRRVALTLANRAMAQMTMDTINNYKDEYGMANEKDMANAARIAAAEAFVRYASMAPVSSVKQLSDMIARLRKSKAFNKRFNGDPDLKEAVLSELENMAKSMTSDVEFVAKMDELLSKDQNDATKTEIQYMLRQFSYKHLLSKVNESLGAHDNKAITKDINTVTEEFKGNALAYNNTVIEQYRNEASENYLSQQQYQQMIMNALQNGQYITDNRISESARKFINTIVQLSNSLRAAAMVYAPRNQEAKQNMLSSIDSLMQQFAQLLTGFVGETNAEQLANMNETMYNLVNQMKSIANQLIETYQDELVTNGGLSKEHLKGTIDFLNNLIASVDVLMSQEVAAQVAPGSEGVMVITPQSILNKLIKAVIAINSVAESIDVGFSKAMRANANSNTQVNTYIDDLYDKTNLGKSIMQSNKAQSYNIELSNINKKLEAGDFEGELERDRVIDDNILRITKINNNIRDLLTYLSAGGMDIPFFQTYIYNALRALVSSMTNNEVANAFITELQNQIEQIQSNQSGNHVAAINMASILYNVLVQHINSNQELQQVLSALGIPYQNTNHGGNIPQILGQMLAAMALHSNGASISQIQENLSKYSSAIATVLNHGTKITVDEYELNSKRKTFLKIRLLFNNIFRIQTFQTVRQIHESYKSVVRQANSFIANIDIEDYRRTVRSKIDELKKNMSRASEEEKGAYKAAIETLEAQLKVIEALDNLHKAKKTDEEPIHRLMEAMENLRDKRSEMDENATLLITDINSKLNFVNHVASAFQELRATEYKVLKTLEQQKEAGWWLWKRKFKLLRAVSANDKQALYSLFTRDKDGYDAVKRLAVLEKRYLAIAGSMFSYANRHGGQYMKAGYNLNAANNAVLQQITNAQNAIQNGRNQLGNNSAFLSYDSSGIFGDLLPDVAPGETLETYYNRHELRSIVKSYDDRVKALYSHRKYFATRIAEIMHSTSPSYGRRMIIDLMLLIADRDRVNMDPESRYRFEQEEATALVANFLEFIGETDNQQLQQFLLYILTNMPEVSHNTFESYVAAGNFSSATTEALLNSIMMFATGVNTNVAREGNTTVIYHKPDVKTTENLVNAAVIFYIYDYIFNGTRSLTHSSILEDIRAINKARENAKGKEKAIDTIYVELINKKIESLQDSIGVFEEIEDELKRKLNERLGNVADTMRSHLGDFFNHNALIERIAKAKSINEVYKAISEFIESTESEKSRKELREKILNEIRGALKEAGLSDAQMNLLNSQIENVADAILESLQDVATSIVSTLVSSTKDTKTSKSSSIRNKLKYLHSLSTKIDELRSEVGETNNIGEANITLESFEFPPMDDSAPVEMFGVYDHNMISATNVSISGGRIIFNHNGNTIHSGIPTEKELRALAANRDINFRLKFVASYLYMLGYSNNKIGSILGISLESESVVITEDSTEAKKINMLYNMVLAMYGLILMNVQQDGMSLTSLISTISQLFGVHEESLGAQLNTLLDSIHDNIAQLEEYGIDVNLLTDNDNRGLIYNAQDGSSPLFGSNINYNSSTQEVGLFDGLSRVVFESLLPRRLQYILTGENTRTLHNGGYVAFNAISAATRLAKKSGTAKSSDFELIKSRVEGTYLGSVIKYSKATSSRVESYVGGRILSGQGWASTVANAESMQSRVQTRGGSDLWIIPETRNINDTIVAENNIDEALNSGNISTYDLYDLNLPVFHLYDVSLSQPMPPVPLSIYSLDEHITDNELSVLTKDVEAANINIDGRRSFYMASVTIKNARKFYDRIVTLLRKNNKTFRNAKDIENIILSLMHNGQSVVNDDLEVDLDEEQTLMSSFANIVFSSLSVLLNTDEGGNPPSVNLVNLFGEIVGKLRSAHSAYKLALQEATRNGSTDEVEKLYMLFNNDLLLMSSLILEIANQLGVQGLEQRIDNLLKYMARPIGDRIDAILRLADIVYDIKNHITSRTQVAQQAEQQQEAEQQQAQPNYISTIYNVAANFIAEVEGINIGIAINKVSSGFNMNYSRDNSSISGDIIVLQPTGNANRFATNLSNAFAHLESETSGDKISLFSNILQGDLLNIAKNMDRNSQKTVIMDLSQHGNGLGIVVFNISKDGKGRLHVHVSNVRRATVRVGESEQSVYIEHDFSFTTNAPQGANNVFTPQKLGSTIKTKDGGYVFEASVDDSFFLDNSWKKLKNAGQSHTISGNQGLTTTLNNIRTSHQTRTIFVDLDKAKTRIKTHRSSVYAQIERGQIEDDLIGGRYLRFNNTYAGNIWHESTAPIIVSTSSSEIKENIVTYKEYQAQAQRTREVAEAIATSFVRKDASEFDNERLDAIYESLEELYSYNDGKGNIAVIEIFNHILNDSSYEGAVNEALSILHDVIHAEGNTLGNNDLIEAYNQLSQMYTNPSANSREIANAIFEYIHNNNEQRAVRIAAFLFMLYERSISQYSMAKVYLDNVKEVTNKDREKITKAALARKSASASLSMLASIMTRLVSRNENYANNPTFRNLGYSMYLSVLKLYNNIYSALGSRSANERASIVGNYHGRSHLALISEIKDVQKTLEDIIGFNSTSEGNVFRKVNNTLLSTVYNVWVADRHVDSDSSHATLFAHLVLASDQPSENIIAKLGLVGDNLNVIAGTYDFLTMKETLSMLYFASLSSGARRRVLDNSLNIPAKLASVDETAARLSQNPVLDTNYVAMSLLKDMNKMLGGQAIYGLSHLVFFLSSNKGNVGLDKIIPELARDASKVEKALRAAGIKVEELSENQKNNISIIESIKRFAEVLNKMYELSNAIQVAKSGDKTRNASDARTALMNIVNEMLVALKAANMENTQLYKHTELLFRLLDRYSSIRAQSFENVDMAINQAINNYSALLSLSIDAVHTAISTINSTKSKYGFSQSIVEEGAKSLNEYIDAVKELIANKGSDRKSKNIALLYRKSMELSEISNTYAANAMWQFHESNGSSLSNKVVLRDIGYYKNNIDEFNETLASIIDSLMESTLSGTVDYGSRGNAPIKNKISNPEDIKTVLASLLIMQLGYDVARRRAKDYGLTTEDIDAVFNDDATKGRLVDIIKEFIHNNYTFYLLRFDDEGNVEGGQVKSNVYDESPDLIEYEPIPALHFSDKAYMIEYKINRFKDTMTYSELTPVKSFNSGLRTNKNILRLPKQIGSEYNIGKTSVSDTFRTSESTIYNPQSEPTIITSSEYIDFIDTDEFIAILNNIATRISHPEASSTDRTSVLSVIRPLIPLINQSYNINIPNADGQAANVSLREVLTNLVESIEPDYTRTGFANDSQMHNSIRSSLGSIHSVTEALFSTTGNEDDNSLRNDIKLLTSIALGIVNPAKIDNAYAEQLLSTNRISSMINHITSVVASSQNVDPNVVGLYIAFTLYGALLLQQNMDNRIDLSNNSTTNNSYSDSSLIKDQKKEDSVVKLSSQKYSLFVSPNNGWVIRKKSEILEEEIGKNIISEHDLKNMIADQADIMFDYKYANKIGNILVDVFNALRAEYMQRQNNPRVRDELYAIVDELISGRTEGAENILTFIESEGLKNMLVSIAMNTDLSIERSGNKVVIRDLHNNRNVEFALNILSDTEKGTVGVPKWKSIATDDLLTLLRAAYKSSTLMNRYNLAEAPPKTFSINYNGQNHMLSAGIFFNYESNQNSNVAASLFEISRQIDRWYNDISSSEIRNRAYKANKYKENKIKMFKSLLFNIYDYTSDTLYTNETEIREDVILSLWRDFGKALNDAISINKSIGQTIIEAINEVFAASVGGAQSIETINDILKTVKDGMEKLREEKKAEASMPGQTQEAIADVVKETVTNSFLSILSDAINSVYNRLSSQSELYEDPAYIGLVYNLNRIRHIIDSVSAPRAREEKVLNLKNRNVKRAVIYALYLSDEMTAQNSKFALNYSDGSSRNSVYTFRRVNILSDNTIQIANRFNAKNANAALEQIGRHGYSYYIKTTDVSASDTVNRLVSMIERHVIGPNGEMGNLQYIIREDTSNFLLQLALSTVMHASLHGLSDDQSQFVSHNAYVAALEIIRIFTDSVRNVIQNKEASGLRAQEVLSAFAREISRRINSDEERNSIMTTLRNISGGKFIETFNLRYQVNGQENTVSLEHTHLFGGLMNALVNNHAEAITPQGILNHIADILEPFLSTVQGGEMAGTNLIRNILQAHAEDIGQTQIGNETMPQVAARILGNESISDMFRSQANLRARDYFMTMRELRLLSYYDAMDGAITDAVFINLQKSNKRSLQQAGTSDPTTTVKIKFVSDLDAPLYQGVGVSGGFVFNPDRNTLSYYPLRNDGGFDNVPHGQDDLLAIVVHSPSDMAQMRANIRAGLLAYTTIAGDRRFNAATETDNIMRLIFGAYNEDITSDGPIYGSREMDDMLRDASGGQSHTQFVISQMASIFGENRSYNSVVEAIQTHANNAQLSHAARLRLLKLAITDYIAQAFSSDAIEHALRVNHGNQNDIVFRLAQSLYSFIYMLSQETNLPDNQALNELVSEANRIIQGRRGATYVGVEAITIQFANAFFKALSSSDTRKIIDSILNRATNGNLNMRGLLVNLIQLGSLRYIDTERNDENFYGDLFKMKGDLAVIYNAIDLSGKILEAANGEMFNNSRYVHLMRFLNSNEFGSLLGNINDGIKQDIFNRVQQYVDTHGFEFKSGGLQSLMNHLGEIIDASTPFSYLARMSGSMRSQSTQNDSFSYTDFAGYYELLSKNGQGTRDVAILAWKLQGNMSRNMHLSLMTSRHGRRVKAQYGETLNYVSRTNRLFREDEAMSLGKLLEDAEMVTLLDRYLTMPASGMDNVGNNPTAEDKERLISFLLGTHLHTTNKKSYIGISGTNHVNNQLSIYLDILRNSQNVESIDPYILEHYLSTLDTILSSYVREAMDLIANNSSIMQAISNGQITKEQLMHHILRSILEPFIAAQNIQNVNLAALPGDTGAEFLNNVPGLNQAINTLTQNYTNIINAVNTNLLGNNTAIFNRHILALYSSSHYIATGQYLDNLMQAAQMTLNAREIEKLSAKLFGNALDYNLDALTYTYMASYASALIYMNGDENARNMSLTQAIEYAFNHTFGQDGAANIPNSVSTIVGALRGSSIVRDILNRASRLMYSGAGRKFNPIKTSMNGYGKYRVNHLFQVKTATQLMSHYTSEDMFLRSANRMDNVAEYNIGVNTILLQMAEERKNYNGTDKRFLPIVAAESAGKVAKMPPVLDPSLVAHGVNGSSHTSTHETMATKINYGLASNGRTDNNIDTPNKLVSQLGTEELVDRPLVFRNDDSQYYINELDNNVLTTTSAVFSPLVPTGTEDNETEIPIQMFQHVTENLIAFMGADKATMDLIKRITNEFDGEAEMITEAMAAVKKQRLAATNTFNVYHHAKMYRAQLGLKAINNPFSIRSSVKFAAGINYLGGDVQSLVPKVRVPMGGQSSISYQEVEYTVINGMHGHGVFQGFIGDDGDGDAAYMMMMYNLYSTLNIEALNSAGGLNALIENFSNPNLDLSAYASHVTGVGILLDEQLNIMGNNTMREFVRRLYVDGVLNGNVLQDVLSRIYDVMRSYKMLTERLNSLKSALSTQYNNSILVNALNQLQNMEGQNQLIGYGLVTRYLVVGRILPAILQNEGLRQQFQQHIQNLQQPTNIDELANIVLDFVGLQQNNTDIELRNLLVEAIDGFVMNEMSAFKKDIANLYGTITAFTLTGSNIETAPSQSGMETMRIMSQRAVKSRYLNVGIRHYMKMDPLFALPFPREQTNKQSKHGIGQAAIIESALHVVRGVSIASRAMRRYNIEMPRFNLSVRFAGNEHQLGITPMFTVQQNQDFVSMVNIVLDLLKYPDGANITYENYHGVIGLVMLTKNTDLSVFAASQPIFHDMIRFLVKHRDIMERVTSRLNAKSTFGDIISILKEEIGKKENLGNEPYVANIQTILSKSSVESTDNELDLSSIRNQNDVDDNTKAKIAALAAISLAVGNDLTTIGQIFSVNRANNMSNKFDYVAAQIAGLTNLVEGYEAQQIGADQPATSSRFVTPLDHRVESAIRSLLKGSGVPMSFVGIKLLKDSVYSQIVKPSASNVAHGFDLQLSIMNEALHDFLEEKGSDYYNAGNEANVESLRKHGDYYNDRARKVTSTMALAMFAYHLEQTGDINEFIMALKGVTANKNRSDEATQFINDMIEVIELAKEVADTVFGGTQMFNEEFKERENDVSSKMSKLMELEKRMYALSNKYFSRIHKMPDQTASKLLANMSNNSYTIIKSFILDAFASAGNNPQSSTMNSIPEPTLRLIEQFARNIGDIFAYMEVKSKESKLNSNMIKNNLYLRAAYKLNSLMLSDAMIGLHDAALGNLANVEGDQEGFNTVAQSVVGAIDGFTYIISPQNQLLEDLRFIFGGNLYGENNAGIIHFLGSVVLPGFAIAPHSGTHSNIFNKANRSEAINNAIEYSFLMRNRYKEWFYGGRASQKTKRRYMLYQGNVNLTSMLKPLSSYNETISAPLYTSAMSRAEGTGMRKGQAGGGSITRNVGGNNVQRMASAEGGINEVAARGEMGREHGAQTDAPRNQPPTGAGEFQRSEVANVIPMIYASRVIYSDENVEQPSYYEAVSSFTHRSRAILPVHTAFVPKNIGTNMNSSVKESTAC